jgi:uncharacterized protein (DUF952 family)
MIYHLITPETWATYESQPAYSNPSLDTEGFIHCSRQEQIEGVLARFFEGVTALQLLHIDESQLTSPLRYEAVPDAPDTFPHVFGLINREAIVAVTWVRGESS